MIRLRNRHLIIVATAVIILLSASAALAVDNINDLNQEINKQPDLPTGHNIAWDFVKLVLALAVIVGAAWAIVRMFGKQASTRMQGTWLHTVDELMLGQNRGLVLCEVAGKIYAVGVTDHNINLLFEVDNPQILKEISEGNYHQQQQNRDVIKNTAEKFRELFNKKEAVKVKDFHSLMQEQGKRLSSLSVKGISAGKVNREDGENK